MRKGSIEIRNIAAVNELLCAFVPFRLRNGDFIDINPDENRKLVDRQIAEQKIKGLLDWFSF
jgi:hypothetical protein